LKFKVLVRFCADTRAAFDRANLASPHDEDSSLSQNKFPMGCCGDTSKILTHLIFLQFGVIPIYRSGTYKSHLIYDSRLRTNNNHAWLEVKELKIDITADQFNDRGFRNPKVMLTKSNKFHRLFADRQNFMDNLPQKHLKVDSELISSSAYIFKCLKENGWDLPFLAIPAPTPS